MIIILATHLCLAGIQMILETLAEKKLHILN
nr:MAG TPA: hypothetical protein [Caudoviricetes sp.]